MTVYYVMTEEHPTVATRTPPSGEGGYDSLPKAIAHARLMREHNSRLTEVYIFKVGPPKDSSAWTWQLIVRVI